MQVQLVKQPHQPISGMPLLDDRLGVQASYSDPQLHLVQASHVAHAFSFLYLPLSMILSRVLIGLFLMLHCSCAKAIRFAARYVLL